MVAAGQGYNSAAGGAVDPDLMDALIAAIIKFKLGSFDR
jgi:hypothetical protein